LLAAVRSAEEAVEVRRQAHAVEIYLRQHAVARDAALDAAEIRLRAERRAGELLAETVRPGGNGSNQHGRPEELSPGATNARLPEGITRSQSSRWQRVATLPEADFEQVLEAGRRMGELSTRAMLRAQQQAANRALRQAAAEQGASLPLPADAGIWAADFRDLIDDRTRLPDGSVSLIFVDPPYAAKSLHLYGDLARLGARVLKDGGSLIAYAGHYALLDILSLMTPHLRHWWTLCLRHGGPTVRLAGKWVFVGWKPLLWLVKGGRWNKEFVADLIHGEPPDKELHDWQQGLEEAKYLIQQLTAPGETVLDPMCGSGTTVLAALSLGRQAIGIEVDASCAAVARKAIHDGLAD
jgi:16S rRNA G966 N2-methylase RsmD